MTEPVDRHASWLELFFDLVVVVAVSQLAHVLHSTEHHEPGGLQITMFFTLYLAIWLVWTIFTLYSNVVADRVRARAMFLGMAGIATMAATVPHLMDGRANVFAAAYLVTSAIGGISFTRSGRIMLSWTAASQNAGLIPWIASFWVDSQWWKLSLSSRTERVRAEWRLRPVSAARCERGATERSVKWEGEAGGGRRSSGGVRDERRAAHGGRRRVAEERSEPWTQWPPRLGCWSRCGR